MKRCSEFILLDLRSQFEAVYAFTQEWTPDEILTWMRQYGIVIHNIDPEDQGLFIGDAYKNRRPYKGKNYFFCSNCCYYLISTFWITDEGHLSQSAPHRVS